MPAELALLIDVAVADHRRAVHSRSSAVADENSSFVHTEECARTNTSCLPDKSDQDSASRLAVYRRLFGGGYMAKPSSVQVLRV